MSLFTTPRTPEPLGEELTKHDLIGALIIIEPTEYTPDRETRFGKTDTLLSKVVVCDGDHAGETEDRFFAAGNLARQIAAALPLGKRAPGRIVTGQTGRSWYGIEWAEHQSDITLATKVWDRIHPSDTPPASGDPVPF